MARQERTIRFGPRAQEVLRAFLRPGYQERFLFSPTLAELCRRERMRAQRRTPLYPSHVRVLERKRRSSPKRHPRDRYDVHTYYRAILRACGKAKVPHWSPGRLRHNSATRIRKEYGVEAAKAVLGHRLVETACRCPHRGPTSPRTSASSRERGTRLHKASSTIPAPEP